MAVAARVVDAGLCARVHVIRALGDNYQYLVEDRVSHLALAVDPVEPDKILRAADAAGARLAAAFTTHRHYDHAGGNLGLHEARPELPIYGSTREETPGATHPLEVPDGGEGRPVAVGTLTVTPFHVPCHTKGHVMLLVRAAAGEAEAEGGAAGAGSTEPRPSGAGSTETPAGGSAPLLFTGDTLFLSGCGRFFEGDAAQFCAIARNMQTWFPANAQIFCGHEYTAVNARFALSVDGSRKPWRRRLQAAEASAAAGQPTIPAPMGEERECNIFLAAAAGDVALAKILGVAPGEEAVRKLREMKDNFKDTGKGG